MDLRRIVRPGAWLGMRFDHQSLGFREIVADRGVAGRDRRPSRRQPLHQRQTGPLGPGRGDIPRGRAGQVHHLRVGQKTSQQDQPPSSPKIQRLATRQHLVQSRRIIPHQLQNQGDPFPLTQGRVPGREQVFPVFAAVTGIEHGREHHSRQGDPVNPLRRSVTGQGALPPGLAQPRLHTPFEPDRHEWLHAPPVDGPGAASPAAAAAGSGRGGRGLGHRGTVETAASPPPSQHEGRRLEDNLAVGPPVVDLKVFRRHGDGNHRHGHRHPAPFKRLAGELAQLQDQVAGIRRPRPILAGVGHPGCPRNLGEFPGGDQHVLHAWNHLELVRWSKTQMGGDWWIFPRVAGSQRAPGPQVKVRFEHPHELPRHEGIRIARLTQVGPANGIAPGATGQQGGARPRRRRVTDRRGVARWQGAHRQAPARRSVSASSSRQLAAHPGQ